MPPSRWQPIVPLPLAPTPMRPALLPTLRSPRQFWREHGTTLRLALLVAAAYAAALAMDMP